ncbi:hypothetical protein CALVIDRAFT_566312 [Calocera viscosa TUFC12733]|uniref:Luciferase domain-containing protein n=1 Tax=Calocera viscosa (strain TUFC12733) TaxID=1330018 RepID=A0A167JGK0_CALVF|nr:hypothetical protein CALVIDRAFT_566312 [Calocera viscosa TUFC12733]
MATAHLPPWLHAPTVAGVRALWDKPVTLGNVLLSGVGIYTVTFLVSDIYTYYALLPQEMRGTNSANPLLYVFSGLIRSVRWLRGLDGTSTSALRRFVEKNKRRWPLYGRKFLGAGEVPVRRGPRAKIVVQGVPHRQVPQLLDEELEKNLKDQFRAFGAAHGLEIGDSKVEPNALALFLPPRSPSAKPHPEFLLPRSSMASAHEYVHIHGGESSLHLILAPLDAVEAIEKGWAVRFPLAGAPGPFGTQGRVMVYAPRDEGEVGVIMRLVEAGWEYLTVETEK